MVIPANEGFHVLSRYIDTDDSEQVLMTPVLAWHIYDLNTVYPVTFEGVNELDPILNPNGQVVHAERGEFYKSVDEWKNTEKFIGTIDESLLHD